ncbi:MAG: GGDEF-domain containing protein [Alphaproteobacteria bacterium]|nr:MAG: GGDEF-domain containing protein [Alphaproteobacteria bacterium]
MPANANRAQKQRARSRFDRDVGVPFLVTLAATVGASLFDILLQRLAPDLPLAHYGHLLPAVAAVVSLSFLWMRLAPVLRSAFANEDALAQFGGVEERQFSALRLEAENETAGPGKALSLAYTDPLTGLGNRMRMMEKFRRLVESRASEPAPFAVGLMNLDGMKPINDLFGNAGGDEIIKQCALRLAAAVEGDGFVCRYGGDEFAFIFPYVADERAAADKGTLLHNVLLAPFDLDGRTVRLSGSFGFAIHPQAGETFDEVMANIGTALYHSKRRGRGRVTIYTREIEAIVRDNARIEQALRNAIANNEVRPHFQPILSLQDGRLLGFEALARWFDVELGSVSPGKFIPLAEERGIIAPLTDSLLLQAARSAAEWPEEMFLSFNLSSVQLVDLSTASNIMNILQRAGLPPHRLEIEVTETAMMSDPETAAMIIDELHKNGARISMDDFGTGQSSLGRLRELRLDKVKIDRAFVKTISEDKSAEHIVRAILEMCAGLELTVVAEGIEDVRQAELLKAYGCHAGQGYLFGKPQDANRTMGYIRDFLASYAEVAFARRA